MEFLKLFPANFPPLLSFSLICGLMIMLVIFYDGLIVVLKEGMYQFLCCFKERFSSKAILSSDPGISRINGLLYYNSKPFTGRLVDSFDINALQKVDCYRKGVKHGFSSRWDEMDAIQEEKFFIKGQKQ